MEGELLGLRSYVAALELQNKSKTFEQEVLHRELETLNAQLAQMQQYYFQNRELLKEIGSLRLEVDDKQQEVDQLKAILQQQRRSISKTEELEALVASQEKIISSLEQQLASAKDRQSIIRAELEQEKLHLTLQSESNQELKLMLENKETELAEIKIKMSRTETNESEHPSFENGDQSLIKRIEELEEQGEEREDKLKEMEDYIEELQYCCESLNNQIKTKEIELRQLKIEITYLQRHQDSMPKARKTCDRFHRSQVATPRWKVSEAPESRSTSGQAQNRQHSKSSVMKSSSERSLSQCNSSVSMGQQAKRLQRRNNILKKQNEMLLKNIAL